MAALELITGIAIPTSTTTRLPVAISERSCVAGNASRTTWRTRFGALGFLGLGIPPPTPDWGGMINEGRQWIFAMPWTVLAPAIGLSSMVVGLNLLADGMRENAQAR